MSSDAAAGLRALPGALLETRTAEISASKRPADGDDVNLLCRIQKGDKEALGQLFDRYASLVHGIGLRILRDTGEADDLVQEVFLFLFRKSGLFDPAKGSARSWLVQVTYCRAFDRRDYLGRRPHYHQSALDDSIGAIGSNEHLLSSAELSYWNSYLRRAFEGLSSEQKETLTLYFFEGYSLLEISQKLGQSLVSVRHYYYRGLARLRKQTLQANSSTRSRV